MSDTTIPTIPIRRRSANGVIDRFARRLLRSHVAKLRDGQVVLRDLPGTCPAPSHNDAPQWPHDYNTTDPLRAVINVHDRRFDRQALFGGSMGVAESYIAGGWSCDDLTSLFRIFLRSLDVADSLSGPAALASAWAANAWHWLRRNTREGSRRNIHAHYDLGNELFELMLDDTMMYSCGIFESADATLHDASVAKVDRICRKLGLQPTDHVVEIGTGWGGFAIHAAKQYGCRITTTTISREQYDLAVHRITRAGVADRVKVLLEDYRDLKGTYDKLVSIEMIEAVGHEFLPTYFKSCARLLKPEGLMVLQAITMNDQRYARYRRSVDFIRRHVFPGACIPSMSAMTAAIAKASDFRVHHVEDFGIHYAHTLRAWRQRFFSRLDDVRALGYPDTFIRLWEYYLCYCEAGFAERYTGDVHMVLAKPRCTAPPMLGALTQTSDRLKEQAVAR